MYWIHIFLPWYIQGYPLKLLLCFQLILDKSLKIWRVFPFAEEALTPLLLFEHSMPIHGIEFSNKSLCVIYQDLSRAFHTIGIYKTSHDVKGKLCSISFLKIILCTISDACSVICALWCVMCDVWCVMCDVWCVIHVVCCVVYNIHNMPYAVCYMIYIICYISSCFIAHGVFYGDTLLNHTSILFYFYYSLNCLYMFIFSFSLQQ